MKRTRLLAFILAMLFVVSIVASCGSNQNAAAPAAPAGGGTDVLNETGFPIAKSPITYTAMMTLDPADGRWEDLELMQWLEDLTNVKFKYETYEAGERLREQLRLNFAANSYADVIIGRNAIPWREDEEFGKDGFFIDHKPLMEKYMPNAMNCRELYPAMFLMQVAGDGAMYGLPFNYQGGVGGNCHLWYMEEYWYDAVGMTDMPNTVDEMRDFMYAIKALMDSGNYFRPEDDMYVLGYANEYGLATMCNVMMAAWTGAISSPDNPWGAPDNKTIKFLAELPGFRKTIEFFRDLYADGLIDPDVFTMESGTFNSRKNDCKYAMYSGSSSSLIRDLIRSNPDVNPDYVGRDQSKGFGCLTPRPLTSEYNSRPLLNYETIGNPNQIHITDKAKNPEVLARWCDIFYNLNYDVTDNTVPNPLMFYKGYYGVHWEYTNLQRTYWTFLPTPDGTETSDGNKIDWAYSRNYLLPGWSLPCGIYIDDSYSEGTPMYVAKQNSNVRWQYPYCTTDTQMPGNARMTTEEQDEVLTQLVEVQTYLRQSWALFMSGQKEINDANWDDFLKTCKQLGSDEVTAVYQKVYDRWNAGK